MRFIVEIVTPFLTAIVLCAAMIEHPHSARCPAGWWLHEGVRDDGRFACARIVRERAATGSHGGYVDASENDMSELRGRVYCRDNERAQTVDGVSVLCR